MTNRTLNKKHLTNILCEAQEHLYEAISFIEDYVRDANDAHAETYLLDPLRILTSRNHNFLCSDLNIDDLIDQLNESDDEEE